MNLQQLEYIVAVEKKRQFVKAAEECNVTQATLSAMVKKLEKELNVEIFDRSNKPVKPTAIGEKVIVQAKKILKNVSEMQHLIENEMERMNGSISIGVIPTIAPYLLPKFIPNFLEKYPEVHLQIFEIQTEEIVEKILQNELDVGILVTPLNEPQISEIPLYYEEFFAYVSRNHDLFKEKEISPKDLNINGLWLLSEGHCFREQVLNICNHDLETTNLTYESGSIEVLCRMVEKGLGYTLIPEMSYDVLLDKNKELVRKFMRPIPVREVSLVIHKSSLFSRLVEAIIEEIENVVPEHMRKIQSIKSKIEWKNH